MARHYAPNVWLCFINTSGEQMLLWDAALFSQYSCWFSSISLHILMYSSFVFAAKNQLCGRLKGRAKHLPLAILQEDAVQHHKWQNSPLRSRQQISALIFCSQYTCGINSPLTSRSILCMDLARFQSWNLPSSSDQMILPLVYYCQILCIEFL